MGSIVIRELQAAHGDISVRSDGPVAIAYSNRTLTFDPAAILVNEGRVDVAGSLPVEPQASATAGLSLRSRLDLASLRGLIPALEARLGSDVPQRTDTASVIGKDADLRVAMSTLEPQEDAR